MSDAILSILRSIGDYSQYLTDRDAPVDSNGAVNLPKSNLKKITDDLITISKGDVAPLKWGDLDDFMRAAATLGNMDDRELALEKLVVLMSRLPAGDKLASKLQEKVILALYNDLPHPANTFLTTLPRALPPAATSSATLTEAGKVKNPKNVVYAARPADGSNYNILFPDMGKANTPYARTVPSTLQTPLSALPDPGLVFDTLLKRDEFKPHPGGVSALFFAFADLVIHSIFATDHFDPTINKASSYLDLSPLYGSNGDEVAKVRSFDGFGSLKKDTFSDIRLLLMPPAVCALLVLFNRNHNYIAQKILDINERGNFKKDLSGLSETDRRAQDDEIFERARLVNTGFFMQVILGDYVGAILGLVRDRSSWRLDPLMYARSGHAVSPRGEGNVVSVEFNLMYRWHSTLSAQDTEWTTNRFSEIFGKHAPGKSFSQLDADDFKRAAHGYFDNTKKKEELEFDGAKRNADGTFNDADLARIIHDSTGSIAASFGARGIPEALRVVEVLGIEQARNWGTCSMNEFRKFMGQKPFENFEDWNSDREVNTAAAALYGNIDNLELYVGLAAEEAKPPVPGAGLCPGYTISRAILADAVCLTRGDRFLTTEFTPFNLTSWGYQDCQFDKNDGSYGGLLTKLLFRTLPQYFPPTSAYAHFPFLEPQALKEAWTKTCPEEVSKYTWHRPTFMPSPIVLDRPNDVKYLLNNGAQFQSLFDRRLAFLSGGRPLDREPIYQALGSQQEIWNDIFGREAERLVKDKSFKRVGSNRRYLDAVKDVINLAAVHVVSRQIWGIPIKDQHHPTNTIPEQKVAEMYATVTRYMFSKNEPGAEWSLSHQARQVYEEFTKHFKGHVTSLQRQGFLEPWIVDKAHEGFMKVLLKHNGDRTNKSSGLNNGLENLAASLFAVNIPTTGICNQAAAHVLNFYLDDEREEDRALLGRMYAEGELDKMVPYMWKALRTDPPMAYYLRIATKEHQFERAKIPAGHPILATVGAETAPKAEKAPIGVAFDPAGIPEHTIFSSGLFENLLAQVTGPIFALNNVRRAPGNSGKFNRVITTESGVREHRFVDGKGRLLPHPTSLVVEFDD